MKRQFLWQHLDAREKRTFLAAHATRFPLLNVAARLALHGVALTYMLALSLVLGGLAAQHLMPLRLPFMLEDGTLPPELLERA
jgi:hypothetical protein